MTRAAVGAPEHRPHEEARGEDPAGVAGAQGEAGGVDLRHGQEEHEPAGQVARQRALHVLVAVAEDLGQGDAHGPGQRGAQDGLEAAGQPRCVEAVADGVEAPDEVDRGHRHEHAEEEVERNLPVAPERVLRHVEGRPVPLDPPRHQGADPGADHHGREARGVERAQQHDLVGEEHAGDGGVERAGDAPRHAARDQGAQALAAHAEPLSHEGAEGAPDLGDGALHSCGTARPDRDRGGDRLDRQGARPEDRSPQVDVLQEPGEAVAHHLPGEQVVEGREQAGPGHGEQGEEQEDREARVQAEGAPAGLEDQGVEELDEAPEEDVAQARQDADRDGHPEDRGVLRGAEVLQPGVEAGRRRRAARRGRQRGSSRGSRAGPPGAGGLAERRAAEARKRQGSMIRSMKRGLNRGGQACREQIDCPGL